MSDCDNINDSNGLCSTLESTGTGLGVFLNAIKTPLIGFVLVLALIGGIVAVFYSIATMISNSIRKHHK